MAKLSSTATKGPEDFNLITDKLIAEARRYENGSVCVSDIKPGWYEHADRKPFKRKGVWCVHNYGPTPLLSYERNTFGDIRFRVRSYDYTATSILIENDGGNCPKWFKEPVHRLCAPLFMKNSLRRWTDIISYLVEARYETDLPEQYRERKTEACCA